MKNRAASFIAAWLMLTATPARAEPPACWKVHALVAYAGSEREAEKLARRHGFSKEQIAEARKRCLR